MKDRPLHIEGHITELAQVQQYLKKNKEPHEFFDHHGYCLDMRDTVLEYFGLPKTNSFTKILEFENVLTNEEVDQVFEKLESASWQYKMNSKYYETEEVGDYINQYKDANEVFEFLQVTPHDYMLFIYTDILYERKDSIEAGIAAMRAADDPQFLDLLDRLRFQDETDEKDNIIRFLVGNGIKYLNEYITHSKGEKGATKNKLVEFWEIINKQPHHSEYEIWFTRFTNILMNDLCLVVNKQPYRIIESEIYFFDGERHHDLYTHQSDEQLQPGQWYFNGYGLDITFGNPDQKTYGGILIRGIKKLGGESEYISGPSNVLREIMSNMGTVLKIGHGLFLQETFSKTEEKMNPVQSTRIGLSKKEEDKQSFIDKPYRYIVELNPNHKFKDKTRVVENLLDSGLINLEKAKRILGYNLGVRRVSNS